MEQTVTSVDEEMHQVKSTSSQPSRRSFSQTAATHFCWGRKYSTQLRVSKETTICKKLKGRWRQKTEKSVQLPSVFLAKCFPEAYQRTAAVEPRIKWSSWKHTPGPCWIPRHLGKVSTSMFHKNCLTQQGITTPNLPQQIPKPWLHEIKGSSKLPSRNKCNILLWSRGLPCCLSWSPTPGL